MKYILFFYLIYLFNINGFSQQFIFYNPPQTITDLKIGRYDSILILASFDSSQIGKKIPTNEILLLNKNEFLNLFKYKNQIIIKEMAIEDKTGKNIYSYLLPLFQQLRIVRLNDSSYTIYESYLVNINNKNNSIEPQEVIKYNLYVTRNNIKMKLDKSFFNNFKYLSKNYQSLIHEYNSYKTQKLFITKDWAKIPESNVNKLQRLSINLTFAAINGCTECEKILNNFRKTFSIINCGLISENFAHCEAILNRIKQIH